MQAQPLRRRARRFQRQEVAGSLDGDDIALGGAGCDTVPAGVGAQEFGVQSHFLFGFVLDRLLSGGGGQGKAGPHQVPAESAVVLGAIGKDHYASFGLGIVGHRAGVAGCLATVKDEAFIRRIHGDDPPAQSLLKAGARAASLQHRLHRRGERRVFAAQEGVEEGQDVVGAGAQATRGQEGRHHDFGGGLQLGIVSRGQPGLHGRGHGDGGALHSQRARDPRAHQGLVVRSGALGERLAEQRETQVRVFPFRADVARQLEAREELVRLRDGVLGDDSLSFLGIGERNVGGEEGQPGGLGRQIHQGDGVALPLGQLHAGREVLGHGIVELEFSALDHIGEHERREDLGDRSDLEDGVAIERALVARVEMPVGNDAPARWSGDADDHSHALMLRVDAIGQNRPKLGVGR